MSNNLVFHVSSFILKVLHDTVILDRDQYIHLMQDYFVLAEKVIIAELETRQCYFYYLDCDCVISKQKLQK